MNRETITPTDEAHWLGLRVNDLTSTDIPALFGLSPYKTPFELWHEKKAGERVQFAENDRMKWGKRLESTVAEGIAEDQDWAVRPMKEYVRLPDLRLGSSFDFRVQVATGKRNDTYIGSDNLVTISWGPDGGVGTIGPVDSTDDAILEIKTVDFLAFRDGWVIEDGFIEAPAHIEIQVQHQMLVSGLTKAYIGVMVGGNRIEVLERTADPAVHAGILAKAREFWQSIDDGRAPDPVMPDDADAVIRMNQFAEPGKFLDARGDASIASLLQQYQQYGLDEKIAAEHRKVLKAEILTRIGDAEKVVTDVGKISASITGPAEIKAFTRAPFRNFRVTMTTQKEAQEAAQ